MLRIEQVQIYRLRVAFHASYSFGSYDPFHMAVVRLRAKGHGGRGEATAGSGDESAGLRPLREMAQDLIGRELFRAENGDTIIADRPGLGLR
jgi:hypothetical protein